MPHQVKTVVDLIRHGEPEGGMKFRGRTDHPLSERGFAQMERALAHYQGCDVVVTSPLKRCVEFAQTQATRFVVPLWIDSRLREMSFGDWEGLTIPEVEQNHGIQIEDYWENPVALAPPNSELIPEFKNRIEIAWDDLIRVRNGQRILVVAHGAVIRMIFQKLMKFPLQNIFHLEMPFAACSRIELDDRGTARLAQMSIPPIEPTK
jgi:broad specificity phosphatase PhoE